MQAINGTCDLKPSRYNVVFRINDTDTFYVFNCVRRSSAIVPRYFELVYGDASYRDTSSAESLSTLLKLGMVVTSKEAEENEIFTRVFFERFPAGGYLGLTICPTLNCPLACPYCYQRPSRITAKKEWNMSPDVEHAVLRFAEANLRGRDGLSVCWYGGEPLLRWNQFRRLSSNLRALVKEQGKNYHAGIVTSGWTLSEKKVCELVDEHGVTWVQVTLEMPPQRHQERRLGPKGENILPHLVKVITAAATHLTVDVRLNLAPDDLSDRTSQEIITFLTESGILQNPNVKAITPCLIDADLYYRAEKVRVELTDEGNFRNPPPTFSLEQLRAKVLRARVEAEGASSIEEERRLFSFFKRSLCGALQRDSFVVLPDGSLHKCWSTVGHEGEEVGNVMDGVNLSSPNLGKWLRFQLSDFKECQNCAIFPICLGGCAFYRLQNLPAEQRCMSGFIECLAKVATVEVHKALSLGKVTVTLVTSDLSSLPAYLVQDAPARAQS